MKRLLYFAPLIAVLSLASCKKYAATSTAVTCTTTTSTTSATTSISTCTDPVTNISVTIAPATVSVNVVTTQQFLVSIQGGTNNVTIWKVNNITGGNDTVGRIDSNGLYHAPTTLPSPATVNVTAVSFEDQNVSATSTVTITPAPLVTITSPSAPPTVTSGTANTVTFSATETGGTTDIILWYVGPVGGLGVLGGNATLGTINANGVYRPPLTPPIGQTVTVTAAAQDSPTSTASLAVTISGYSTFSLQGLFAFSMAGSNASGQFFRAGSFVADGAGNLNSGMEDINDGSVPTSTPISFVGSYSVTADGRGTLTLNDGKGPAPSNSSTFHFVMVNGTQLQIIGFDTTGTATGQANAQDITTFHDSALIGTYVFDFAGMHGSTAISEIGEFTADGAGHITGGSIDINDGGTSSPFQIKGPVLNPPNPPVYPSFYSINSNGRGTATIATTDAISPTLTFSFYIVSRGSAKFVGMDTTQAVAGVSMQQAPNVTFDQTSLNGNYAFLLAGSGSGGSYALAGSFSAGGNLQVTNGSLDENFNGAPNPNVTFSGTYTVAANGRGTASFTGGRTYVFYLGPAGTAVFQETDANHPNIASDGAFVRQQNASFALSQISGTYAVDTAGLSGASTEVITGEMTDDGAGSVASGAIDINTAGTTASGVAITGAYAASSSVERGTLALNLAGPLNQARNFAVYVVSSTQAFIVEIDAGVLPARLAAGALLRQF